MPMKKMNRRLAAVAIPAMLAAGAAQAGGLAEAVVEPAPAPAPVMAAPAPARGNDWTGFYVGGQLGYGLLSSDSLTEDLDGATYGVHAGYLYDLGSWVLGGEVDYDLTSIEDADAELTVDSIARAKLRVGYDAGVWMPYVTGGVAQVSVTDAGAEASDTGAFGGLGIDYMYSDSIRIGAEILQHQFDDFDGGGVDFDATTASARVSFQF